MADNCLVILLVNWPCTEEVDLVERLVEGMLSILVSVCHYCPLILKKTSLNLRWFPVSLGIPNLKKQPLCHSDPELLCSACAGGFTLQCIGVCVFWCQHPGCVKVCIKSKGLLCHYIHPH